MIALFPGRFQPFVKGHLDFINHYAADYDKAVIGIRPSEQIFSLVETYNIIDKSATGYSIVFLPEHFDLWYLAVQFDVIVTANNELADMLDYHYSVICVPRYGNNSATQVRKRLARGLDINEFVCPGTGKLIARTWGKNGRKNS